MYLHPKNRSISFQKRRKMLCSHHFRVFTWWAKNGPFSCEREAYPSHSHRFQNMPASCERSFNFLKKVNDLTWFVSNIPNSWLWYFVFNRWNKSNGHLPERTWRAGKCFHFLSYRLTLSYHHRICMFRCTSKTKLCVLEKARVLQTRTSISTLHGRQPQENMCILSR